MTTATGYNLTDDTKDRLLTRMENADARDVNSKITGMMILRSCGALLGVVFLAVNAYQATWALMKLAGMGDIGSLYDGGPSGLTADQWTVGATAFGLVLAAQVIAIRMAMSDGATKAAGIALLLGLMAFSVVTSAMHIAFKVEGGVIESTRQSDDYKLAKARYEAALASKSTAETDWTRRQEDSRGQDPWTVNTTHSKGPGRPFVERIRSAESELAAAKRDFDSVKKSGGGAEGTVVTTMASALGMTSAQFALWFALFAVVLMELTRVYLSFLTGNYLMEAMADARKRREEKAAEEGDEGEAKEDKPEAQPAPQKVMASSAPAATDTIRGPVLRDPIEVEGQGGEPAKPRAMFAPQKRVQSAPADRGKGNKRQAEYSKKLARLKKAIEDGSVKTGAGLSFDVVKKLAQGGNRDTVTALRNDLALSGVAHWKGARLIAGAA